jgi:hypothetical protein
MPYLYNYRLANWINVTCRLISRPWFETELGSNIGIQIKLETDVGFQTKVSPFQKHSAVIFYGLGAGVPFPVLPQIFQFDKKLRLVLITFQFPVLKVAGTFPTVKIVTNLHLKLKCRMYEAVISLDFEMYMASCWRTGKILSVNMHIFVQYNEAFSYEVDALSSETWNFFLTVFSLPLGL